MRFALTDTEEMLWRELRGGRLGAAFRRQVPVGRYVVDFLAPSVKLAVEVDGGYHAGRRAADERRDRYLARLGYTVLRFDAELVRKDVREVLARITQVLRRQ
ncbi:MAG: hypothetical protein AMXMBFR56_80030 [Polyangiaceae bacterium]